MLQFNPKAIPWFIAIFAIEILIALHVRDAIIRPYGGDLLAVVLVYAGARVFVSISSSTLAWLSFAVGCTVELFQLFGVPGWLELQRYPILHIAVGTTFQWGDLVAYALGALLAWIIDERTSWLRASSPR